MFRKKKYKILRDQTTTFHFQGEKNREFPVEGYRIMALRDIPRYKVKAGDIGGYVTDKNCLSQNGDAWIGKNGFVSSVKSLTAFYDGKPAVRGNALVTDFARVINSVITQEALVSGQSTVVTSIVSDRTQISKNAFVYHSIVKHRSSIMEYAHISGSLISGAVTVLGKAEIFQSSILDRARISGQAKVAGSIIANSARIRDNVTVRNSHVIQKAECSGKALLMDSILSGIAKVKDEACLSHNYICGTTILSNDASLPQFTVLRNGHIENAVDQGIFPQKKLEKNLSSIPLVMEVPRNEYEPEDATPLISPDGNANVLCHDVAFPKDYFTPSSSSPQIVKPVPSIRDSKAAIKRYTNSYDDGSSVVDATEDKMLANANAFSEIMKSLEQKKAEYKDYSDYKDEQYKRMVEEVSRSIDPILPDEKERQEEEYKNMLEEMAKSIDIITAYGRVKGAPHKQSNLPSPKTVQTPKRSDEFNRLISVVEEIEQAYESYTLDIVKLLKYPLMADVSVPEVGDLVYLLRSVKRLMEGDDASALSEAVEKLDRAFIRAEGVVQTAARSHLDSAKRKKVETAEQMLLLALDKGSTDNEKKVSFKAGIRALEGVIPLREEAIDNLRDKAGLLAIES